MKKRVMFAFVVLSICAAFTHAHVKIDSAIDFSLTDARGITHNLYDDYLTAGKWVLLSFTGKN